MAGRVTEKDCATDGDMGARQGAGRRGGAGGAGRRGREEGQSAGADGEEGSRLGRG